MDPLFVAGALGEPADARLVEPRGTRLAEVVTDVVLQRDEEVIRRDGHRVSKRGREGDCVCGEVWSSACLHAPLLAGGPANLRSGRDEGCPPAKRGAGDAVVA